MKKKKRNKNISDGKKVSLKDRLIHFFSNMFQDKKKIALELLIIFLISFIGCSIIALQRQPINTHQPYGDNYYYYASAKAFSKVWSSPVSYFFSLVFHNLSDREAYEISLNHQSHISSFFRAPSFIAYFSLWLSIFGDTEFSCLMSQVFLLALIFTLIYYILYKKSDRKYAIAGLILSFLYVPFHTASTMTLTELFQALTLLIFFIVSEQLFNLKKISFKKGLLFSFLLLIATLSKSSLKFIYLFLLPLFLFLLIKKYHKKIFSRSIKMILISFIIVLLFWFHIESNNSSDQDTGNMMGWLVFWAGGIPAAEGMIPYNGTHVKEFRDNIGAGTIKFWYTRYAQVCKPALFDVIAKNPLSYFSMIVKKFSGMMSNPTYHFKRLNLFKLKKIYMRPYHYILLVGMILGLLYIDHYYIKHFFIGVFSYFFAVYSLANPDTRFLIPLIPFFIILAVLFIVKIISNKKFLVPVKIGAACLVYYLCFNRNFLVVFIKSIPILMIIKFLGLMGLLLYVLYELRKNKFQLIKSDSYLVNIFIIVYIIITGVTIVFDNLQFNHFILRKKNVVLKQEIILNNDYQENIDKNKFLIAIDLHAFKTNDSFLLSINDKIRTNIALSNARVTVSSNYKNFRPRDFYDNKWIYIPVPKENITQTNRIELVFRDKKSGIFYQINSKKMKLPSLFNRFDTQIVYGDECLYDGRFFENKMFNSIKRRSYINGKPCPNATFNIYLLKKGPGDYYIDKKYSNIYKAALKYVALVNPIDRKIVFWSQNNPGVQYERIRGNLQHYIVGELDRFHSGYIFH